LLITQCGARHIALFIRSELEFGHEIIELVQISVVDYEPASALLAAGLDLDTHAELTRQ
jgi:hypothetical protein